MKNIKYILLSILVLLTFCQCEEELETKVFDEYNVGSSPSVALMEALLNGAYSNSQVNGSDGLWRIYLNEFSGDHMWNEIGGVFRNNSQFLTNFNWTSVSNSWMSNHTWTIPYRGIRNINIVLDALESSQLSEEEKISYRAQCQFIRGTTYYFLYNLYGPVPLRTTSTDDPQLNRTTDQAMQAFIEEEFLEAVSILPEIAPDGMASKATTLAMLTKFYLNTKQWQKCVDSANELIAMGQFELYTEGGEDAYRNLFWAPESGNQKEFIYQAPNNLSGTNEGNPFMSHSYPSSSYISRVDGSDPKLDNQQISGTKNRLYDFFVDGFEEGDIRLNSIVTEFINVDGELEQNGPDRSSPFKYRPDPNALATRDNNNYAIVRYADILLSKAEALAEVNGPNQESMDLVNMIRTRAQTSLFNLADYSSPQAFRDLILDERGRELWGEAHRRDDLIRHGKFVTNKINHPVTPVASAEDFRVRYPFPQVEIDANPNLEQNIGY